MDAEALRNRLVDGLIAAGFVTNPRVEAAFRAVPRHLFLPGVPLGEAYADEAILTHYAGGRPISSSSQPAIMAAMLEQLDVHEGDRVLEVGSGTGYNAALLAFLAGPGGLVVTVDIEPAFVFEARQHLLAAGYGRVRVEVADGFEGYPECAPYQRIIVTASTPRVAPAWDQQLATGGRLVLPLADPADPTLQSSTAFEKTEHGLQLLSRVPCGFMPLRREPQRRGQRA